MPKPEVVQPIETASDEKRELIRSTIKFPYLDQDDSVDLAKAIQRLGATQCGRDALAATLGLVPTGGGFALRLATARLFGILSPERGTNSILALTTLGVNVLDPSKGKAARVESFLQVPLYKRLYDDFKGKLLPPNSGLEGYIEQLGVSPKQKDKARQVFQRSATQAGFFAFGTDRLVAPSAMSTTTASVPADQKPPDDEEEPKDEKHDKPKPPKNNKLVPTILGLLDALPNFQTEWSMNERRRWLQSAATSLDLLYKRPQNQDEKEIKVSLE